MLYQTLIIFIGIVIGSVTVIVLFWSFKYRDTRDEEGNKPGLLRRGIVGHQMERKRHNIEKLKNYIEEKKEITNDEVENLLGVSHATAWRYLNSLKDAGLIEQVGKEGQSVRYRAIGK